MWTCARCRRSIDATMGACWACGTSRDGVVDPTFEPVEAVPSDGGPRIEEIPAVVSATSAGDAAAAEVDDAADGVHAAHGGDPRPDGEIAPIDEATRARSAGGVPLRCLRCHDDLRYRGRRALPFSLASSGDAGASDDLDVYACPTCGRVEAFLRP